LTATDQNTRKKKAKREEQKGGQSPLSSREGMTGGTSAVLNRDPPIIMYREEERERGKGERCVAAPLAPASHHLTLSGSSIPQPPRTQRERERERAKKRDEDLKG